MKITIEAVFSVSVGTGSCNFAKEIYLNDEFMGCIGFTSKLEFETEKNENTLKIVDCKNEKPLKSTIKYTASGDVYFWIVDCISNWKGYYTKVYGKGKDYKLISEIKE